MRRVGMEWDDGVCLIRKDIVLDRSGERRVPSECLAGSDSVVAILSDHAITLPNAPPESP